MPRLLFVSHTPSPNTTGLRDNALAGIAGVELRARDSLEAGADDVLWCDGIAMATTENFGSMAGRSKDFLERIYYPCLERTQGLPVAAWVRAGQDGAGTVAQLERIITGLRWRWIAPPLVLHGDWDERFLAESAELLQTLAAGLDAGIF